MSRGDIRILVADRHPMSLEALGTALSAVGGFKVVGLAGTGPEALAQGRKCLPDVTLLDLDLGEGATPGILPEMLARCPGCSIVVLTIYPGDGRVESAMEQGARAHLSKGAPLEDITRTILCVHHGQRLAPPGGAARVRGPEP